MGQLLLPLFYLHNGILAETLFNEALNSGYDALDQKDDGGASRKTGTALTRIYLHPIAQVCTPTQYTTPQKSNHHEQRTTDRDHPARR